MVLELLFSVALMGANVAEPNQVTHLETLDIATDLYEQHEYEKSIRFAEQVNRDAREYNTAKLLLAKNHLALKNTKQAEGIITEMASLKVDPHLTLPLRLELMYLKQQHIELLFYKPTDVAQTRLKSLILLYRGYAYSGLGDELLAEGEFKQAISWHAGNMDAITALASLRLTQRRYLDSMQLVDEVLLKDPLNQPALLIKTNILSQQGNASQALAIADILIKESPSNAQGLLARAALNLELGQYALSFADIEQVMQLYPNEPMAHYLKMQSLQGLGQEREAVKTAEHLTHLLSLIPSEVKDQNPVFNYLGGLVSYQLGSFELAYKEMRAYLHKNKNDLAARKVMGNIQLQLGQVTAAKNTFLRIQAAIPNDIETLELLALCGLRMGNSLFAARYFNKLIDVVPENIHYRTQAAKIALSRGQSQTAIDYFGRELVSAQSRPALSKEALSVLARAYLQLKKPEQGFEFARQFAEQHPSDSTAHLLIGTYLGLMGHPQRAYQSYAQALEHDPKNFEAAIHMARIEYFAGSPDVAIARLVQYAKDNQNASVHNEIANIYLSLGSTELALRHYHQALKFNDRSFVAASNIAQIYEQSNDSVKALSTLREFLSTTTQFPQAFIQTIDLLDGIGKKSEALNLLERFSRQYADQTDLLLVQAKMYVKLDNKDLAAIRLKRALLIDPTFVPAYDELVDILIRKGDIGSAKYYTEQLAEQQIEPVLVEQLRGDIASQNQDWLAAISFYEQALKVRYNKRTVMALHQIYRQRDKNKSIEGLLHKAIEHFPEDIFLNLALADNYSRTGHTEKSITVYEELLHTHPEHPVILNNAANLYIDINDLERADELAQRALTNAPNEPLVLDTVGWIAAQKGELELSLSLLRQAETLKYNDPTISGHIVDVLIRMGRFDEAQAQRAQNDERWQGDAI